MRPEFTAPKPTARVLVRPHSVRRSYGNGHESIDVSLDDLTVWVYDPLNLHEIDEAVMARLNDTMLGEVESVEYTILER